jgi:hypothetical protein
LLNLFLFLYIRFGEKNKIKIVIEKDFYFWSDESEIVKSNGAFNLMILKRTIEIRVCCFLFIYVDTLKNL